MAGGGDISSWFSLIFRIIFGALLLLTAISMVMNLINSHFQNVNWLYVVINIILVVIGAVAVILEHLGACLVYLLLYILMVAIGSHVQMGYMSYDYTLSMIVPILYAICLVISGKKDLGMPSGLGK